MAVTYFKRFRMETSLLGRDYYPPTLPAGYQLHTWNDELIERHAQAKYRSFCTEIDSDVFPCLGDGEGCLRLMGEISHRDGFLAGATWLISWGEDGDADRDFCGTIQGILDRAGAGAIQNLGVAPEHRGRGLGTFLLMKALEGFQRAGVRRVYLEVTAKNKGAIRLYRRLGFKRVRTVYKAVRRTDTPVFS